MSIQKRMVRSSLPAFPAFIALTRSSKASVPGASGGSVELFSIAADSMVGMHLGSSIIGGNNPLPKTDSWDITLFWSACNRFFDLKVLGHVLCDVVLDFCSV